MNAMSGYGVNIHALRQKDLDEWTMLPGDVDLERCILVEGEDMASAPAAIIEVTDVAPIVIWFDKELCPGLAHYRASLKFAEAVVTMIQEVHPEIGV